MKRILAFMLAAALTLSLCACGKKQEQESEEQETEIEEPVESEPSKPNDTDYMSVYRDTLDRYGLFIATDEGNRYELGISDGVWETVTWQIPREEALGALGYTLRDVSGDGVPELIIGEIRQDGEPNILYAMYTVSDDEVLCVLESWARSRFYLMDDGRFGYEGSSGAMSSAFGIYTYSEDALTYDDIDFYFSDMAKDNAEVIEYYHNNTGEWDMDNSEKVEMTADEFWKLADEMKAHCVTVELTSFAEYMSGPVRAQWAENAAVSVYDEFAADASGAQSAIMFTTETEVQNFRLLALTVTDVDENGKMSFDKQELYSQTALTPERALRVELTFVGDLPAYGISYTDDEGVTKEYSVEISGADGSLLLNEIG